MRPTDPRVLTQLAPARRQLSGVVVGSVMASALVVAQAFAVTHFVIDALDGRGAGRAAVVVMVVLVARAVVGWTVDLLAARAAALVGTDMRRRLMRSLLSQTATGATGSTGELSVLATRGVAAAEPYLTRYLPALLLAGVLPIVTLVAIATQDVMSAMIVLVTLPLVPVFGALVGLATRDRAAVQWRAMESLSGHFLDVMRGLPTLVVYRRAQAQSGTIRRITDRYRQASLGTLRLAFASSAVLELVATLSVALVAVVVGLRLATGHLELGTALVVLLLAPEAYWPLRRVGAEFHAAAEGIATFERVDELAAYDEVQDEPSSYAGAIVVRDLTVIYPGRTTPALAGVCAVLPDRGVTVLVGPSGCGKSTLLASMAGLIQPTEGEVRVGGAAVGGAGWRSQVAWLPQRPMFLTASVAENLRLAAPDATDDQLWSALRRVALEERVRALPSGLNTSIGEDGRELSAGERARLALARVVLAGRPWVFLDEPTAHLDEVTEQLIADTIVELAQTSGVVVVAHRPLFVELADHVVRLVSAVAVPQPAAPDHAPVPVARSLRTVVGPLPARPFALSTVIGALASASGVALTATAGWLIVQASQHPPVLTLLVAVVGVRAFGLARPVLRYVERLRSHDAALRLLADRRVQVYDAVVPLTPGRLGKHRGDVLSAIVDDVDGVVDRELRVRLPVRGFVLVAVLVSIVAAMELPVAGAIVGATAVAGGGLGFLVARLGAARCQRHAVTARAELSARVVETAQVAPELTMWQADEVATTAVVAASDRLNKAVIRAATAQATGRAMLLVATGAGVAAMGLVASAAVSSGALSRPMLALLVLLPLAIADVAIAAVDAGGLAAKTRAAEQRLREIESTVPAVSDPAVPATPRASYVVRAVKLTGGWDGSRVLQNLTFGIDQGERVGVIGPSGSGKSTLAAMLLRFIDPDRGLVMIGGIPMRQLALDDIRREIGLVDDDPHVFASTLVENIRLARPYASNEQVEASLRAAHLGEWLDALPDGLGTWLGDGHGQVSGGERARLGLARALLANQPVLVLDEPTAHLDAATAAEVARDVLVATTGRSIVWITHDPTGLDQLDRVLDLANAEQWA
ncbi:MAG: transporter, transrane region, type 1 [Marmoricola sp.]|nr:transporter, transrane region, type 1 [Marmoricola sp.]